jgi:hypothetical protein
VKTVLSQGVGVMCAPGLCFAYVQHSFEDTSEDVSASGETVSASKNWDRRYLVGSLANRD